MDIRPISPDEFPAFCRAAGAAFGEQVDNGEMEAERSIFEFDRSLAACDDGQIVATAAAYSFDLTLPGLTTLPAAGVSWVSVLPTHRRRGLLRALMRRQLDDVRARGEPLAILGASESVIYGRFGYGIATDRLSFNLDRRHAAFAQPPEPSGRLALLDREQAARVLPEVYERARLPQPGAINRSAARWQALLRDPVAQREGASPYFYVVYTPAPGRATARVDGYARYRIKNQWDEGLPNNTLLLRELVAKTPEAHATLWHYLLNVDLIGTVHAMNCPVDEPLRWLLADPRRMCVTRFSDGLWVRIVDVPAALSARRYALDGRLVLELADPFCPDNAGCYALEGGPSGATCRRTTATADLALGVADLGAIFLGGVRPSMLARAGRVVERTPAALSRADLMFACAPAPWCATFF